MGAGAQCTRKFSAYHQCGGRTSAAIGTGSAVGAVLDRDVCRTKNNADRRGVGFFEKRSENIVNMFKQIAEQRYSLRHFDANRPVEREKIDYVLQCACMAPSAVNLQPYHFFVVTNTQTLTALNGCYQREWFADAPVCVVACADHTRSWHRPNDGKDHADIDVAIAVDHLTLAAAEVGLGTCWVCNFDAKRCAAILHLPADVEPLVLVPMGYAAAGNVVPTKKRKLPEELFTFV